MDHFTRYRQERSTAHIDRLGDVAVETGTGRSLPPTKKPPKSGESGKWIVL